MGTDKKFKLNIVTEYKIYYLSFWCLDMSRRAIAKVVDWTRLAATIPKAHTAEFNAFRLKHETLRGALNTLPEKPTPINWDHYMSVVKNKALVEQFHAAYSQLAVSYPEDTETAKINARQAETEVEILKDISEREARIAEYTQELGAIKAEKPYEEMTVREHMEANPDQLALHEAEMKKNGWM